MQASRNMLKNASKRESVKNESRHKARGAIRRGPVRV
jgi:hypothetical protein